MSWSGIIHLLCTWILKLEPGHDEQLMLFSKRSDNAFLSFSYLKHVRIKVHYLDLKCGVDDRLAAWLSGRIRSNGKWSKEVQ